VDENAATSVDRGEKQKEFTAIMEATLLVTWALRVTALLET
jgi:hypothetical protein